MKRSCIYGAVIAPLLVGCLGAGAPVSIAPLPPGSAAAALQSPTKPHAAYVIVVMMENRDYDLIVGSRDAPYINKTLIPQAALMTDSHGVTHPSQPNYLAFFSGATQGVHDDSCPHSFGAPNAGEELIGAGKTFDGYSESMPYDGYTGCYAGEYARKHNPWVDFSNVPSSSNLVYHGFVRPPSTLTIVVPNLCHDMHDCSTETGDDWLAKRLPPILDYDKRHDGLLILTWDEADPDANGSNRIATLLLGPMIRPGKYGQKITHYSVLRTIEDIGGISCTANACDARALARIWR